jgi:ABC-2 type transport system permease protein
VSALRALVRKDVVLFLGNRRALLVSLLAPVLIAAFMGAVLGGDREGPTRVPVAVVDLDRSEISTKLVAAMQADATFELQQLAEVDAIALVRRGKIRAAAVIPAGFGDAAVSALFRPSAAKPQIAVHYDPSQGMALPLIKGLLAQHVMQVVSRAAFGAGPAGAKAIAKLKDDVRGDADLDGAARGDLLTLFDSIERVQARTGAAGGNAADPASPAAAPAAGSDAGPAMGIPYETRDLEVTSGESHEYNAYAHSFAGMGVQFILLMGVDLGVGLLVMRRLGLWKRLRAAPVSRAMLLGSHVVSGMLIALLLLAGIYAAAIVAFGVRIEGSLAGFVAVAIAFSLLTSTFGLLLAAVGRTPEATRGIAIVATLMLVMLGGAWVPTFVFPEWLQTATQVVPTRWAIDALDAMTWRALGFEAVLWPVAGLLACSAVFAGLAVRFFDWEE